MQTQFDRRQFLRAAGVATLAVSAAAVLPSCTTGAPGTKPSERPGGLTLPTYRAPDFLKPDLVSAHPNGLPAFLEFPSPPTQVFPVAPLKGGEVTAMTYTYGQVVPGISDNVLWQNLNESLGATLNVNYAPSGEYASRFATTIAGGDIPDIVTVVPPVQQLPQLLEARFADLTDHLSGDAVLNYPGLATIPTDSWRAAVFNQAIWGVPMPRSPIGSPMYARADLIRDRGLPVQPQDWDEFVELLSGLTNDREGRWAMATMPACVQWVAGTYGLSGDWMESDGRFTNWVEAEEFEAALADVRKLVEVGVFHPDGATSPNTQNNEWFLNGTAPLILAGYAGWGRFVQWGAATDGFELTAIVPFGRDGAKPAHRVSPVTPNFAAIRQGDGESIERALQTLNWLCTPFGTEEYIDRRFGVAGATFDFDGADPILNALGVSLAPVPFEYVANSLEPIYQAGLPQVAQARFDYQEQVLPMITADPTNGLVSETSTSRGQQLGKLLSDAQMDILSGRQPVSSWADSVVRWRSQGGDLVRGEYEKAFAEANAG